jgi:ribosome-binding protein aMBF1 (putative translation factor)
MALSAAASKDPTISSGGMGKCAKCGQGKHIRGFTLTWTKPTYQGSCMGVCSRCKKNKHILKELLKIKGKPQYTTNKEYDRCTKKALRKQKPKKKKKHPTILKNKTQRITKKRNKT